jgi:aminomethyltransferase
MSGPLLKTPLHDWHAAHGGRMVDFAGWSMPVQYGSIVEEHNATRTSVGLFDVSHMGRLFFNGEGAAELLDNLLTRKVVGMSPGRIRYSLMCNESGGILDDVLIYHLQAHPSGLYHVLVVNASNREKIAKWIEAHLPTDGSVQMADRTTDTAMIAAQGPRALAAIETLVGADVGGLSHYCGQETTICGHHGIVSRTGYTGEDGCELIVPADAALEVWQKILVNDLAKVSPAGLAARDTLRLEAAMPLYGHELNEQTNPFQAGLNFAVNLDGRNFLGRSAIAPKKNDPQQPVRVGLVLSGRRVPREHYAVLSAGERVGEVTSGTFSPTIGKPIAMAYVQPKFAPVGTTLEVDIRGSAEPAEVVLLPFHKRKP